MKKTVALLLILSVLFSFTGAASVKKSDYTLNISADNISYDISEQLYGISLEDLSFACDGGLVSNMINNNSFEYEHDTLWTWNIAAENYSVQSDEGMNDNNKNYLSLTVKDTAEVKNNGFTEIYNNKSFTVNNKRAETPDMGFKDGETYKFSAFFKNVDFEGTITASVPAKDGEQKFQFNIDDCLDWKKISLELECDKTTDGAFTLSFEGNGTLLMDYVTLVPKSSHGVGASQWKYTSLRPDLYEALKNLSPEFIRFPGINADGENLTELFSWKNTIGPLEERVQTSNVYRDDEKGFYYNNSNLMGYHEYFTLCSELGAEPVPAVGAGIIRQTQEYAETEEKYKNGALSEEKWQGYLDTVALRPDTEAWARYVRDIFDLIEYANGDLTTKWGALRAENGHPEPFGMKYIALGVENYGDAYWRNFEALYNEIKAKYPEITIIASSGAGFEGETFEAAREKADSKFRDAILDEHYHTIDEYQFTNTDRYDSYERSKAPVMIGEYGASNWGLGSFTTRSNIWSAIENAAFLTGVERNGDIVKMTSYSPSLAKINAQTDDVNMIWFDSQNILLTPDYYMQMMFANNVGNKYISTDFTNEKEGIYQSTTVDTDEHVIYIKLVNNTRSDKKIDINLSGFDNIANPTVQYMDETFKSACNEMNGDLCVAPVQKSLTFEDNTIKYELGSLSVNVIRIPYGGNDGSALFELPESGIISPYIHPAITIAVPCVLGLLIAVTIVVILRVRVKNHKLMKKEETKKQDAE